ncbi:MAG TPA: hypothetical protein VG993_00935 [Actinomycetota bacterium]|nr:hypothetical protein [Actinomycetota bacterium]
MPPSGSGSFASTSIAVAAESSALVAASFTAVGGVFSTTLVMVIVNCSSNVSEPLSIARTRIE